MYEKPQISDAPCFSCGQPAEVHYSWPWGEHGYSCNGCVPHLRSTAVRLGREVEITALFAPPAAAPTERQELFSLTQEFQLKIDRTAMLEAQLAQRDHEISGLTSTIRELQAALGGPSQV